MPRRRGSWGYGSVRVVKLGGSIITDKKRPFTPRIKLVERLAQELARAARSVGFIPVLVLGGGSYGHAAAKEHMGFNDDLRASLYGISLSMIELATAVADAMALAGVYTMIYPPHSFCKPQGLKPNCDVRYLEAALSAGVVPLTFGDVYHCNGSWCIISGDELAVELACKLGSEQIVYVVDVDGLLVDGKLVPRVSLEALESLTEAVSKRVEGVDVTGGLRRKIEAVRANFCPTLRKIWIINGMVKGRLYNVLVGNDVRGTLITTS
ncbi:MAG: isopentenyl phosphate kinase [Thermoproteota archaeon]